MQTVDTRLSISCPKKAWIQGYDLAVQIVVYFTVQIMVIQNATTDNALEIARAQPRTQIPITMGQTVSGLNV